MLDSLLNHWSNDLCHCLSLCLRKFVLFWQLILDMHFTVEIARFAGYPSRHVHQIASAIIAHAIRTFSTRGIDPQRYLSVSDLSLSSFLSALITSFSSGTESAMSHQCTP